jgi:hypothetical protein
VSNATDIDERIRTGFAELLERLRGATSDDPGKAAKANAAALEREQNRVWREYAEQGLIPPSPLALSITARLELGLAIIDQPTHEAAE